MEDVDELEIEDADDDERPRVDPPALDKGRFGTVDEKKGEIGRVAE